MTSPTLWTAPSQPVEDAVINEDEAALVASNNVHTVDLEAHVSLVLAAAGVPRGPNFQEFVFPTSLRTRSKTRRRPPDQPTSSSSSDETSSTAVPPRDVAAIIAELPPVPAGPPATVARLPTKLGLPLVQDQVAPLLDPAGPHLAAPPPPPNGGSSDRGQRWLHGTDTHPS